jgi:hypothetical protein
MGGDAPTCTVPSTANPCRSSSGRSYWIPGSYASTLSEKRDLFLRLLKNKGFKDKSMSKVRPYVIGKSTTLESNKSLWLKGTGCLRTTPASVT